MRVLERKKRGVSAIFRLCPARHVLALLSMLVIALHLLTRRFYGLNLRVSERFVRPVHRALALYNARFRFSMAELLIALAVVLLLAYLVWQIAALIRRGHRLRRLYRTAVTLAAAPLAIYAGFCLLWGVFYYGDDFIARSGLSAEPISVSQLEAVTAYFADLANEYSTKVSRDADGVYTADRQTLIARSPEVYRNTVRAFPCLDAPETAVKGIRCSRIMSALDFTGFFFPFTAEANVNMDFPPALLPATIAHELAHQRGVAKEQEANFVAVLACLNYGDDDFVYSAALMAYTYLGNALYGQDRAAWERIYDRLSEDVLRDFAADRAYWARYETPAREISNTVYENFLYSYDQDLGLRSYGACVDLLVRYYYDRIPAEAENNP